MVFYNGPPCPAINIPLMPFQILGINHTTAPVDMRGQMVIPESRLASALTSLIAVQGVQSGVIVSTCNRTELYCETGFDGIQPLADWFARYHGLEVRSIVDFIYRYQQEEAVRHVLRVASGLDSMILGEPQVLGQLKSAYQTAVAHHSLGMYLERLFQHTFSVAKQIRSSTGISCSPVSVAYAAVTLARQIFSDPEKQTALLVGAGETIELVARHLYGSGHSRLIIANRNHEHAHYLARQFDAFAIGLAEIGAHLAEADIVISATASETPIISLEQAAEAVRHRRHRPMLMVDIAVPRDIDPAIASLEDVYLYNIDDMQGIIQENMRSREAAAEEAQGIIEEHVNRFMGWVRARDAVPTIRAIRQQADILKSEAGAKAQRQLAQGRAAEDVINELARNLTNKLIHSPCSRLHEAGFHQQDGIIETARYLFDLDHEADKP